jgi:hypothetical protein
VYHNLILIFIDWWKKYTIAKLGRTSSCWPFWRNFLCFILSLHILDIYASYLTWMEGPRVLHWHGAISSGRGHSELSSPRTLCARPSRPTATSRMALWSLRFIFALGVVLLFGNSFSPSQTLSNLKQILILQFKCINLRRKSFERWAKLKCRKTTNMTS